jgi:hemerythrin-like domain-containing protein
MAATNKTAKKRAAKRPATTAKRASAKATQRATKRASTARAKTKARKTAPKPRRTASAPDAIAVLRQDHRDVEALFKRFEKAGDSAYRTKKQLVATMVESLSRHAEIEELVFYPAVRRALPRLESNVLEALEEHHLAKVVLDELEDLDPKTERFDAKVAVLIEVVRHHVKEEERTLFPKVRDRVGRRELVEIGTALREAKPRVPTRPHPGAPDEPPANALVGGAVAVIDQARNAGKRAVDRARDELRTR